MKYLIFLPFLAMLATGCSREVGETPRMLLSPVTTVPVESTETYKTCGGVFEKKCPPPPPPPIYYPPWYYQGGN